MDRYGIQEVSFYDDTFTAIKQNTRELCELLIDKQIGNVRDVDYDFNRLWHSPKADEMRRYVRDTRCFCTYECFLTVNILFNPLVLPRVAKEWAALKGSKLRHRLKGGTTEPMATLPLKNEKRR